jgi:CRISPR-associated protein Cmr6
MTVILEPHKKVPMMFRAQVGGRCQLQRLQKYEEPDIVQWADEWVDKVYPELPPLGDQVKTRDCEITWRLITNSGVDDSVIRPVIGARGWVFYPGSSMKGLFRRACTPAQAQKYCGRTVKPGDWAPGSLRFQGGYPIGTNWTQGLVDIVHPQQGWQVEDPSKKSSAFAQISLYKPTLRFGISSTDSNTDWDEVWAIWEQAIATGIGSRVCAGYGHVKTTEKGERVLYSTRLKGQGQAPKLLTGEAEFRPNMFRSGLRGHALRIFGGLTDERTAVRLVEELFGGVSGKGVVGLVGLRFQESSLAMPLFQEGSAYEQTGYAVEGELKLLLTRDLADADQEATLKKLLAQLMQFGMVLGGFGKSWRRADHRLFFEEYYDKGRDKPLIGCHWQWLGDRALVMDVQVRKPEMLGEFINKLRQTAQDWMQRRGVVPNPGRSAGWREAWHPQKVQVWGRVAASREECEAIRWLHGAYAPRNGPGDVEGSIYRSQSKALTGKVGQVGRLWHRMYPQVGLVKDAANPKKPRPKVSPGYVELLTIFPDDSRETRLFLEFLETQPFGFTRLWGD